TAVLGPGPAAPPGPGERGLLAVRERPTRPDRGPVPGLPDGRGPGGWDPRDPPGPGRRPAAPPWGPGRPGRPDRRPAGQPGPRGPARPPRRGDLRAAVLCPGRRRAVGRVLPEDPQPIKNDSRTAASCMTR